ncbi:MAG TPA: hypothetical protein VGZ22_17760, partial [Isosphaeraceae bacterium]|nr:hypothetical protein [Isosphaeraceae bacterium]
EILIAEHDDVLTVPVQAVFPHDGNRRTRYHVAVKKPDGSVDNREVTLGLGNGKYVEVKQGLQSGDVVILNPPAAP